LEKRGPCVVLWKWDLKMDPYHFLYGILEEWHYDKIGVLQLGLQLGFSCCFELQWPFTTLTYIYNLSVVKQVARVATTQFTIYEIVYIYNLCNYVVTIMPMWWHGNDVMTHRQWTHDNSKCISIFNIFINLI
jgi:hypothetical protein